MINQPRFSEQPVYEVDALDIADLPYLLPILQTWIRFEGRILTDEINSVISDMQESLVGANHYIYLVARNERGEAIGVMGLRHPDPKMQPYIVTENPGELINAYVSAGHRGQGVGRQLIDAIFAKAQEIGCSEVILNSGPRYQDTGWEFYRRVMGEPVAVAPDFYGPGRHTPIWQKVF